MGDAALFACTWNVTTDPAVVEVVELVRSSPIEAEFTRMETDEVAVA